MSDGAPSWCPGYGDDRPECGGVGANDEPESRPRAARDTRCLWKLYFVSRSVLMDELTFGS